MILPSEDHTQLTWYGHQDGTKFLYEGGESDDGFHISPLTTMYLLFFRFLEKTSAAEIYFDYKNATDLSSEKWLIVKPSPESEKQIRFSVQVDSSFCGNVTVEPSGTTKHNLIKLSNK